VNALRYTSALGVLCAIYLGAAITIIFFVDKSLVVSPLDNLKHADLFKVIYIYILISNIDNTFWDIQHNTIDNILMHVLNEHAYDIC
jgi:hypothetical protein